MSSSTTSAVPTFTVSTFDAAKDVYRQPDLRQGLYDEGPVMSDVLVNLHGDEHKQRRRVENRIFRRETFVHYERELFPAVTQRTVAPYVAAGGVDLVHLGHELMLNLASLTAGVDRPEQTAEETERLFDYMQWFIKGATLHHSTEDHAQLSARIETALDEWDVEFLAPSVARRRALFEAVAAGELSEDELPKDVLTTLLRHHGDLELPYPVLRREIAFMLLAAAHTSATAFVRSVDHILGWTTAHPQDAQKVTTDPLFVQRCVHETVRLNPSSPISARWALAPVTLRDGTQVPTGSRVVVDLQAVNRDPGVFGEGADAFDPYRATPAGVAPFGLSFATGMHVCIGQDLAAGVVPRPGAEPEGHLFGLVTGAVQYLFTVGVRRDPSHPPVPDAGTARPYWGSYPALLGPTPAEGDPR